MSKGKSRGNCTTCGSDIVETVNDSVFGDGECGGCEYHRYKTQPALLRALDDLLAHTVDADLAQGIELTPGARKARARAIAAIAEATGGASGAS